MKTFYDLLISHYSLVIFDFGCTKTKQVIQSNDHITCFAS